MSLFIECKQYCKLESLDGLVQIAEETVTQDNLNTIVEQITGFSGDYYSVIRNPYHDISLDITPSEDVPEIIPSINFRVGKIKLKTNFDDFSHAFLKATLSWNECRDEWNSFYRSFVGSYSKMLDFVRENHTDEKHLINGDWSEWDQEERDLFDLHGYISIPTLTRY
jgi:hypothetical protein